MLYHLLVPFADEVTLFNVFRYLSFRSAGAVVTALVFAFVMGPPLIDWMRKKQGKGQPIREDGPEGHLLTKAGTPTMGGVLILLGLCLGTLLWAQYFPYEMTGGRTWDAIEDEVADRILDTFEPYAPGTKASVVGKLFQHPSFMENQRSAEQELLRERKAGFLTWKKRRRELER